MTAATGEQRRQQRGGGGGGGGGGGDTTGGGAQVVADQTEPLACPRCESSNTKFCYYNNYNLSQPRYFCKSCRRYWTQGGTLRNIPVGGGSRRNAKRSRTTPASDHIKPTTNACGAAPPLTFNAAKLDHSEVFFHGTFTSLLNSSQGACGSSSYGSGLWGLSGGGGSGHDLGLGLGLEEMGVLGQRRGVWPWMEFGMSCGGAVVDGSFVDGVDCISWPELAISAAAPSESALN